MLQRSSLMIGLCIVLVPFMLLAKTKEFHLTIENHIFTPSALTIPANRKVKLIIYNKDKVSEEFDSFDLNREKVLFPGRKTTIFVGPLSPGRYEYFGEYNPNIARGVILVEGNNAH